MVHTRSKQTEPLREYLSTHREPRDQQSDNSEDSEESDGENCPFISKGGSKYEIPDEKNCSDEVESLPVGERRPKWVLTNLSSRMVCCIRESEIDLVKINCYSIALVMIVLSSVPSTHTQPTWQG